MAEAHILAQDSGLGRMCWPVLTPGTGLKGFRPAPGPATGFM